MNSDIRLLFHISKDKNLDGVTLQPRIPENYFTKNNKEDSITPRVSLSPFIEGCLQSVVAMTGDTYHIYTVACADVYRPSLDEVADQCLTGELWSLGPVELTYYGTVTVGKRVETLPAKSYNRGGDFIEVLLHEYQVKAQASKKRGILVDYMFEDEKPRGLIFGQ